VSVERATARRAVSRVSEAVALGAVPAALLLTILVAGKHFGFDFHVLWRGGRDVLDGTSPYPSHAAVRAAPTTLDADGVREVFRFLYPAGSALVMVPFAALPFHVAAVVVAALSIAAAAGALALLRVRDWRCYGVMFSAIAVITAVRLGTLTPVLLLLLAGAWRDRDRRRGAAWVAVAILLKIFLWPLLVWLAATRRFAAAGLALALAAGSTLVAWAILGFEGLTTYPYLLRRLADVVGPKSYSLVALGKDAGLGLGASLALPWIAGGLAVVALVVLARGRDGDRLAFALAVGASILVTPVVWLHYFALVYVPIALWRRTLSAAWFVPLLLWVTPGQATDGHTWRVVFALAVAGGAVVAARIPRERALIG
jgi:hypothetical protein